MNENTYLNILVESSVISNPKLNPMIEGKTWDKVKKVWRDHKGKIITGAGIATAVAGGLAYRNKSSKTNNTSTTISGSTPQDSTNTNNTTSSSSHKKANDFFDKGREVKKFN